MTLAARIRRAVNHSQGARSATEIARALKASPAAVSSFLHRERVAGRVVAHCAPSVYRADKTAWRYLAFPR